MKISKWKFRLYGSLLAALSALAGSVVFLFTDNLTYWITDPYFYFSDFFFFGPIELALSMIAGIFFIAFFPAVFGGMLLAIWMQYEAKFDRLFLKRSMIFGGILGGLAGLFCSIAVFALLIFVAHRIPALVVVPIHTGNAVFVATLAGIWTSKLLYLHLQGITGARSKVSRMQALEIAQSECTRHDWPWKDKIRIKKRFGSWIISTNSESRGCNAKIEIELDTGKIIAAKLLPR